MDSKSLELLKARVNRVNLNDDIELVLARCGPPDVDITIAKNEKIRFFHYFVTRRSPDSANEFDKVVIIAFNSKNKVKGIHSNVDRIATRNWP